MSKVMFSHSCTFMTLINSSGEISVISGMIEAQADVRYAFVC